MKMPWQALRVIAEGVSIIDSPQLELKNEGEAHQFLLSYGFDLYHPADIDAVWEIYDEACQFVESTLCSKSQRNFPAILKDKSVLGDFKKILLTASAQEAIPVLPVKIYQPWFCAILRVMHTISHMRSDLRLKYLGKIKHQTIGRFEAHLQKTDDQLFLGFERDKIPLVAFFKKESKVRASVLLKLLHKPHNIATEIYDHLGVRFVTRDRYDALLVLKYLIDHHLVFPANAMPARCKNTLLPMKELETVLAPILNSDSSEIEIGKMLENSVSFPQLEGADNPFTSQNYRVTQFTCRPLIRIPVVRKGGIKGEIKFFFPIEVQIMDRQSYEDSETGTASHGKYKEKQLEAVTQRVLRGVSI